MPAKKNKNGEAEVTDSVMKDKVVKAAIKHSGEQPSPGRLKEQAAEQSETSLRTGSQRRINLIWELTQAIVTVMVVGMTLYICAMLVLRGSPEGAATAFLLLSNAFFMIVSTYYQRTNHVRTGGIGGRDVDTDR